MLQQPRSTSLEIPGCQCMSRVLHASVCQSQRCPSAPQTAIYPCANICTQHLKANSSSDRTRRGTQSAAFSWMLTSQT